MGSAVLERCEFVTDRLRVGPWHTLAHAADVDLADVVADMLTEQSTAALPEAWRGDFSARRAQAWITERDSESPTLLAMERTSGRAVGLVIIHGVALDHSTLDVRIGYVIAEAAWGRGLATELVGGLVEWARSQASVRTLTGGVQSANQASARVLSKNGFDLLSDGGGEGGNGEAIYQLSV